MYGKALERGGRVDISETSYTTPRDKSTESFESFISFAVGNTPEISNMSLRDIYVSSKHELDLFVTETSTRQRKGSLLVG